MKLIKVTLPKGRHNVHDGLGGVHQDGAVVDLPDETADALVSMKLAVFADESSRLEAERAHKARADDARLAEQKHRSRQAMSVHDALPPEVRAAVHEHGDDVTENYLAGLAKDEDSGVLPGLPAPRRRRQPKTRSEGGDV